VTDSQPKARLIHCNAIDALRGLPAGIVDAAVFDPPYPTISGGSNADKGGKWQRPSGILTKNDGKIFGHNDISPDEYLPEVFRVRRDDAHLYLMTNVLNIVQKDLLGALSRADFQVHNLLVWRKNNATPNRGYRKDLEYTIIARKGRAFSINHRGTRSSAEVFPHPLDWDNVTSPKSHPTEKPVNLMATYIQNSTQPGEVVLDPFMGTGATGVAALDIGREFIGIEMDKSYCEAASRRIGVPLETSEPDLAALLGEDDDIEALLA